MSGLRILELSPGATIQDRGRTGFRRFGVTDGGAIDRFALTEGQALLGNGADCAAIEFFAAGGRFQSTGRTLIATSGAEMDMSIDRRRAQWRSTILLEAGEELVIGRVQEGVYGYLHLPGGIDGPVVLGSRSTHVPSGLGWIPQPGDVLDSLASRPAPRPVALPRPDYFSTRAIRVMETPQSHLFSRHDREAIQAREFTVSGKRNRMGIRLHCSDLTFDAAAGLTLASDAIVPGDIQISGDGAATALLADSQPVGGYPRLASVISADQHVLAQLPSGAAFGFDWVDPDAALEALKALARELSELAGKVAPVTRHPATIKDLLTYSLVSGVIKGDEDDEG